MRIPKLFQRVTTESGPLIAVTVAVAMLVGIVAPASAQFFPFGFQQQQPPPRPRQNIPQQQQQYRNNPFSDFFAPFQGGDPMMDRQQQQQQQAPRVDYSRAPPARSEKGETAPERHVLVLGDAMADWLAYGLEDALSEQPDIGVTRKHKTVSGLIRYQPRGEPSDWTAAAKGIITAEKADAIVVMLGLHDRTSITETAADRAAATRRNEQKKPDAARTDDTSKPDAEASPDDPANSDDTPSIAAPERGARTAGSQDFRSDRWVELYKKKIEDMIAVAKTKNVPVLWVGLPALRGQRATSDALFLNSLYREVATKSGATYVDVWDGFVDEAGRFMQQGPDFEGQTRRLRSYDGVYFTRAGARKLAHYAEREINRLFAARSAPIEMPSEPEKQPDVEAKPGGPPPRPLWGPIVPLTVSSAPSDQLMGGPTSKSPPAETQVARVVLKGEVLSPPPGRADDGVWPRRELGREAAPKGGEMPEMASTATDGATAVTPASASLAAPPAEAQKKRRPAAPSPIQQASPAVAAGGLDFFGLGGFSQPQATAAAQPRQRQAQPAVPQQQQQVRAPGLFTGGSLGGLFR